MSTKNKLLPHGGNNYAYLLSLHCEILTDFLPCTNFNSYCRINKHFTTFIYTGYTNYYKEHLVSWYFSHILYNYQYQWTSSKVIFHHQLHLLKNLFWMMLFSNLFLFSSHVSLRILFFRRLIARLNQTSKLSRYLIRNLAEKFILI